MSARAHAADTDTVDQSEALRLQIASALERGSARIAAEASALERYGRLEPSEGLSLGTAELMVRSFIASLRQGELDFRSQVVAELARAARASSLSVRQVFGFAYLVERSALDDLALDDSLDGFAESLPAIAPIVRRASFDVAAAFAERLARLPGDDALIDPLTSLHTRGILAAALEKELLRSERFRHPFAVILFDVDRLSEMNAAQGFGVGDRVLERIGIVIRNYFREQDWVARSSGSGFGVLLPETPPTHAQQLAEHVRETVQDRLALRDHRSNDPLQVTLTAAVVAIEPGEKGIEAARVLTEAEEAIRRARAERRASVKLVTVEALARRTSPNGRPVSPGGRAK